MSIFIMCMAVTIGLGYFIIQSGILSYKIQHMIYKNFDHNVDMAKELKEVISKLVAENIILRKKLEDKLKECIDEITGIQESLDIIVDDYMISNQCNNCIHKVCTCAQQVDPLNGVEKTS